MNVNECLLVGVDFAKGEDKGVLIVGRNKEKIGVEIINAFRGEEALDIYRKLITKTNRKGEMTNGNHVRT